MLKLFAPVTLAALLCTGAQAATHRYNIGFTSEAGSPFQTGFAELSTSDTETAAGGYDVTGITGMVSTPGAEGASAFAAISGLSSFEGADNVLYPNGPNVDTAGLGFVSASGGVYDLYLVGSTAASFAIPAAGGVFQYALDYAPTVGGPVTRSYVELAITRIADTAAPEPGTWALMMVGVGLAGATLRRRRFAPA